MSTVKQATKIMILLAISVTKQQEVYSIYIYIPRVLTLPCVCDGPGIGVLLLERPPE